MVFPKIEGRPGYANLGTYAPAWLARNGYDAAGENPLLEPGTCERMVQDLHEELGVAYSYGGWLEDRTHLWRGSYLDRIAPSVHLGVDLNVPARTLVACDRGGRVLWVDTDHPEVHGWGGRVFIQLRGQPDIVLIYAHLGNVFVRASEVLPEGEPFAFTADAAANGGWFPHLHVQALSREAYELFLKEPDSLDGYGPASELSRLAGLYPDPLPFIDL